MPSFAPYLTKLAENYSLNTVWGLVEHRVSIGFIRFTITLYISHANLIIIMKPTCCAASNGFVPPDPYECGLIGDIALRCSSTRDTSKKWSVQPRDISKLS